MSSKNNDREPREWSIRQPGDNHTAPPHLHGDTHQPPHIRTSRIHLDYDDAVIARLGGIYDDVEYIAKILETCPPEIKLTFAMALGIRVDLSEYPESTHPLVRFTTPFLTDKNSELIGNSLNCGEAETAVSIYNSCPPEQALLALAVAALIKTREEA